MTPHSLSALARALDLEPSGTFFLMVGEAKVGLCDDTFIVTSSNGDKTGVPPSKIVDHLKENYL